ncbi:hypothetical protein SAMN05192575_101854 [Nocardioides alpinus]|uniref:Uncharacterized protein n=1 Tax=Nocardioides alpinus TaxID=748909 RepID=A0A1I0WBM3_9ACTN|nr:hypothetical protein [Nocardioides alpinus]PKH37804.1 hypothetical protein CXG46_20620 [Nocardioides alpinus]SFA85777.1 hypothetical protein SAMN05192575_101854 [Nocardioides alpinus]
MTTAMRVLSGMTKLVGGLLALVVLVYLAVNLTAMARGWQQRGELADAFADQATPLLPDLRERQAALGDIAGRQPDRARIEQVCAFDSDDSGWMVNNYRERCSLRTVTAWQVESADAGRALLPVVPPDHSVDAPGCAELGTLGRGTPRPGTDAQGQGVSLALAGRAPDSTCGGWASYGSKVRTVEGDDDPLSLDSTWVVVVEGSGDLIDEDIGCAHWSVLFCDNPFTDHAWADLG